MMIIWSLRQDKRFRINAPYGRELRASRFSRNGGHA
ncbi:MAG: hypothetical protein RL042_768 [Nitrospirota bacterium]